MMIGVDTAGIFAGQNLKGTPLQLLKLGEFLNVAPFKDNIWTVHGHNELITGYCDKNDLIYSNTLYFAEPGVQVKSSSYSQLVDTAKYTYLFKPRSFEFKNSQKTPMLIQQDTYFKLMSLASALEALGYRVVITRAYLYTDEYGTNDYAKGSRLDFELYAGNIKISIPLPEYDESGELIAYSEIEQIFVDNGFERIGTSHTFDDVDKDSYLAYEVDFDSLSYVIMD
jgi:hypothetical protein